MIMFAWFKRSMQVTAKATVLFATTASFGMLVMSMQNLGLIGTMTVEWPEGFQVLFSFCQLFLLDIDSYGFSCLAGFLAPEFPENLERLYKFQHGTCSQIE